MKQTIFTLCLTWLLALSLAAQVSYQQQYMNAKTLFREGKYDLAMEGFQKLIPYNAENPFSQYASFYYALAAYKRGYLEVAKNMFDQIRTLYPDWDKINEAHYWLAVIHFSSQENFQAMLDLNRINDKRMNGDVTAVKERFITRIDNIEVLRILNESYPDDPIIGRQFAVLLSREPSTYDNMVLLGGLISKFHLDSTYFVEAVPRTFKKDKYTVSVLFPLMVRNLDPTPSPKRNQIVLDLLEGMELAVDTLRRQGIRIELRTYDTQRDTATVARLLRTEELKHTDLIVGPLFPEEIMVAQAYSRSYKINMFNPVSRQQDYLTNNPYSFFFQPGNAVLGEKAAHFLDAYLKDGKKCMVFFGPARADTVMAGHFIRAAKETELDIFSLHAVTRETSGSIIDTLATPTEFDEYNNPIQFTLPKDSVNGIFVASEDPLIYSKVISSVETRGDSVAIMGLESWLDLRASDYAKYERQMLFMAAPDYVPLDHPWYQAFRKKFLRTHGRLPGDFAVVGYRFMLFAGNLLYRYGVYFQHELHKEVWEPGILSQGYDYTEGNDNHFVPYIRFQNGQPRVVKEMR